MDNDFSCNKVQGVNLCVASKTADQNVGQESGASSVCKRRVNNLQECTSVQECIDLQPVSPSLVQMVDPLRALNKENDFSKHQSVIDAEEAGFIPDVIKTMASEVEEELVRQSLRCDDR